MSYLFNKTNILIVMVIGVVITLTLNQLIQLIDKFRVAQIETFVRNQLDVSAYGTQETCQARSAMICEYQQCDFIPPGKTVEEVCGTSPTKGWYPTNIPIPEFYQNIDTVRLTIQTDSATGTIELLTRQAKMTYTSSTFEEPALQQEKKIEPTDITRLINKMVLYDLATPIKQESDELIDKRYILYLASKKATPLGIASADDTIRETTISCNIKDCSRELQDIVNTIIRVWGGPVTEDL